MKIAIPTIRGFPTEFQVMFVAVPGICLLISLLYSASVAGGVVVTLLFLGAVAGLIFWWVKLGGCYKVVSLEDVDFQGKKNGRAWEGKMSGRTIRIAKYDEI